MKEMKGKRNTKMGERRKPEKTRGEERRTGEEGGRVGTKEEGRERMEEEREGEKGG